MRQNLNYIAEEMTQFVPLLRATVDNKDGKKRILQPVSQNGHLSVVHEKEKDTPSKHVRLFTPKAQKRD